MWKYRRSCKWIINFVLWMWESSWLVVTDKTNDFGNFTQLLYYNRYKYALWKYLTVCRQYSCLRCQLDRGVSPEPKDGRQYVQRQLLIKLVVFVWSPTFQEFGKPKFGRFVHLQQTEKKIKNYVSETVNSRQLTVDCRLSQVECRKSTVYIWQSTVDSR